MAALSVLLVNPEFTRAASDPRSFLREESEIYLQAYLDKDYDTCLKMMGGSLVNALGGKIQTIITPAQ